MKILHHAHWYSEQEHKNYLSIEYKSNDEQIKFMQLDSEQCNVILQLMSDIANLAMLRK